MFSQRLSLVGAQREREISILLFFFVKFYLSSAVLGLRCCTGFSLVVVSEGYPQVVVAGILTEVASLVAEQKI